ncbi:Crp/Fnr family transcriptional regulator [Bacteroides ovatus]|uniref:Crp/Fnr family transcriptional regulator n=1 Tax=Bacteroides ovatus TaxID=28116 RepID=UPI0022E2B5BA|nr:Crp/Fnr family transcriptional regulator [Bacteroides ovatus]
MNTIEQILKKELKLSDDMCSRFLELVETKHLKKKELFVQQGKVCYSLGIIESGVLRSYIEKDAVEFIKDFYFPGSIVVSYGSFLTGEPSIGSIQALEETYLITLSRSSYGQLLQESSEWFKSGKYISDSLLIKKCRRETSFLMDNAFERYKLLLKTYPQVEQHLSQYYIAAYLGIKPESLSRLKSLNIGQ